jgi:hypothetical protein
MGVIIETGGLARKPLVKDRVKSVGEQTSFGERYGDILRRKSFVAPADVVGRGRRCGGATVTRAWSACLNDAGCFGRFYLPRSFVLMVGTRCASRRIPTFGAFMTGRPQRPGRP